MPDCCNVRTLSYISASLQLVCQVASFIFFVVFVFKNWNEYQNSNETALFGALTITGGIISAIYIAILVSLIVGIIQNRVTLVSIYVYTTCVYLVLVGLSILIYFVMDFMKKEAVGNIILRLFLNLLGVGIFILMFTPIFLQYQRMRSNK